MPTLYTKISNPLHTATYDNNLSAVKKLIRNQADVEKLIDDVPALWLAVQQGHLEVAEELIKAHANVNFKLDGESLLWCAASRGFTKIVSLLIKHGAKVNDCYGGTSPLWIAVQNKHLSTVKELIASGSDVNLPFPIFHLSPLLKAVLDNSIEIAKELINAHADLEMANFVGITPLCLAVSQNQIEIVESLLSAGANANFATKIGCTPFSIAWDVYTNLKSDAKTKKNSAELLAKNNLIKTLLIKAGAKPGIGQHWLQYQFKQYLDTLHKLFPNEYGPNLIYNKPDSGLCFGFTNVWAVMDDNQLTDNYFSALKSIAGWDGNAASLQNDLALMHNFNQIFPAIIFLQAQPGWLRNIGQRQVTKLLHFITGENYQDIFNFGFIFTGHELEKLLEMLTCENHKIYIASDNHIMGIKKISSHQFIFYDSRSDVGPLEFASIPELVNCIKLLLGANTDKLGLNLSVITKNPTLTTSIKYAHIKHEYSQWLLAQRPTPESINCPDVCENTNLAYAAMCGDQNLVCELIHRGAEINPTTGKSPLWLAVRAGYTELANLFIQKGADVNVRAEDFTPIHMAVASGNTNLVKLLIQHGAKLDGRCSDQKLSLLEVANLFGYRDIYQILSAGMQSKYLAAPSYSIYAPVSFFPPKSQGVVANEAAFVTKRGLVK